MIIPGVASQVLAAELAAATDRELLPVTRTQFPDGEHLVELEKSPGTDAVVVASTLSDSAHMDLLLLQDAAREAGVEQLTTVIPYLGYARQDAAFDAGQPVSVRAVARAISTETDLILTVNPHEETVTDQFDVPAQQICCAHRLASTLPSTLTDPLFVAPDAGARHLARTVRDAYGSGQIDHLEKTRHTDRRVDIEPTDADIADRDVVLTDDIIATGGTMVEAVRMLRNNAADRILATCVHPLLAEDAYLRLHQAGVDTIIGTDTVERTVSTVSAAPAIAEALRNSDRYA